MKFNNIKNQLKNQNCNFFHKQSTKSTMLDAKELLIKFESNLVILADQQTTGKGRRGNKWISPKGNIYFSIALLNTIQLKDYFLFSAITLVSIKKTLEQLGSNVIMFKWPNDIYFQNKKFSGIILENFNFSKDKKFVIIGIGINYISSPKLNNYQTTHIKRFVKVKSKMFFLEIFFKNFFYYFNNHIKEKKNIMFIFRNSLLLFNKKIKINIKNDHNEVGIFKGINEDGSLILEQEEGVTSIYSGSILL